MCLQRLTTKSKWFPVQEQRLRWHDLQGVRGSGEVTVGHKRNEKPDPVDIIDGFYMAF